MNGSVYTTVTIDSSPMNDSSGPSDAFRKRLADFTQETARIYEGDAEALHHTRVASRRLRELLPLMRLDSDSTRKLGLRLKKVTRRLGAVRELDVLIQIIQDLKRNSRYSSTALNRLRASVQQS